MTGLVNTGPAPHTKSRRAVLFPGQGSQRQGMGKTLLAAFPGAEASLKALSAAAETDLPELLCQAPVSSDPIAVHLAMVAFGLVAWEFLMKEETFVPAFVAGHSLGEITALACAGVLSPEDAMRLARARGECLAEACRGESGGMLALVGSPLAEMQRVCAVWRDFRPKPPDVWEANYNGPEQLVISGALEALADLGLFLEGEGIKAVALNTAGAFHTPMMNRAAAQFAAFTGSFTFNAPRIPVVSSMSGRLLTSWQGLTVHLALQIVRPVQWLATMQFLQRAQVGQVVEAGPLPGTLESLARRFGGWQVCGLFDGPE
jgi:[acyl-carrier-protein] S-malonyltransferase